jgi:2-polyprenyl-3-methyl-5-hydroxy-6-metoxy-1,4-benzoquinol methylase
MDEKTEQAYRTKAKEYSEDWNHQPVPSDIYQLIEKYFIPSGKTADIGCGNGRDTAWMAEKKFDVFGFDASPDLIQIASSQHPRIPFKIAVLPNLKEISDTFDNVFCETVVMHLSKAQITEAVDRLVSLTRQGGVIYLSWRITEGQDLRHADGRLYTAFENSLILDRLKGTSVLHFEDVQSKSSAKRVCRLVARIL